MYRRTILITLVVVAMLTTSGNAGPIAYGICQAACATGCAACGGVQAGFVSSHATLPVRRAVLLLDGPHSLKMSSEKHRDCGLDWYCFRWNGFVPIVLECRFTIVNDRFNAPLKAFPI